MAFDCHNYSEAVSFGTTQNMGDAPMPTPSYKRHRCSIGQSSHDIHGNFGGNEEISGNRSSCGHPKDAKTVFKGLSKPQISDKKVKRKGGTFGSKSYDSWNKAKDKLTADVYNKLRQENACINYDEVGHQFSYCPKPKP